MAAMQSALDPFSLLAAPAKPAPPPARIRPFVPATDLKVARYIVGAGIMEPSSVANQNSLWTPAALIVWALFTHFLVTRFGPGWPSSIKALLAGQGFAQAWSAEDWVQVAMKWLTISPLVVSPPIVLLALFELRHRNRFESEMTRAIGEEDLRDIMGYYATGNLTGEGEKEVEEGGRKGFWVFEYDGRIIGAVGVDGRKPGEPLDSIVDLAPATIDDKDAKKIEPEASTTSIEEAPYPLRNRKAKAAPTSPDTAVVSAAPASTYKGTLQLRRFATSLSFRPAGIEDDLLQFVASFAFSPTQPTTSLPPAKRLTIALRPSVQRGIAARLKKNGFKQLPAGSVDEYDGDAWKKQVEAPTGLTASIGAFLDKVWPLDLGWKTYALDRGDWLEAQKGTS